MATDDELVHSNCVSPTLLGELSQEGGLPVVLAPEVHVSVFVQRAFVKISTVCVQEGNEPCSLNLKQDLTAHSLNPQLEAHSF